ncbi:uncharacterized protein LOC124261351 [Haliotis rubra]|uniref:uncharacterized protein LOC124261351 n=1 Tax=Haliotis rubra TaxID=36100 RepID=UPI001EE5DC54|nr:uncharacterized protein LOC124261351 [Haliotis rubra]
MMFSYRQIRFNFLNIILWLNCQRASANAVSRSTNHVYTRRPYGVAMCRAWCDKSGGCEMFWFSPDSLGCSITEPVTRYSSFKQLSNKQDPAACGGETCRYLAGCITSRASVYRCVRPIDIRIPTIYIVQLARYSFKLLRCGPNADSEPVKQQTFPGLIKEMINFPLFKCLLVLLFTNELKCISLETLTLKNFCGEKKRRSSICICQSPGCTCWQPAHQYGKLNGRCEEKNPPFKTNTTIFDLSNTITEDPISNFLYFSGTCKKGHGKRCIYKSSKLIPWSQSFVVTFHVGRLVFDKIDNTLRFVSGKKVGLFLPNGTSVINRELPGVLKGMLRTREHWILMDHNGMVVLNRDYSTIARYSDTRFHTMAIAGQD